ncbi:MAG: hypothetical protein BWX48_00407 [Verrucomicrobia bacterium ADurb.Bin006]|jgi:hypothetical protein|nr:MAG: hypothetical protein BWX48_00407 [Verrucomicrobia bacterium ADurb.Bin006]
MGVRKAPRPFQDSTHGFLPHFEAKPVKRRPVNPETARLGPLFSRLAEDRGPNAVVDGGPAPGGSAAREEPIESGQRGDAGRADRAKAPVRREPAGLFRGLLWSGGFGLRSKSRPARMAAQGELSLATVQVKRNDLHDADLELVCAPTCAGVKSQTATAGGPCGQGATVSREEADGASWAARASFWRRWFESRSGLSR